MARIAQEMRGDHFGTNLKKGNLPLEISPAEISKYPPPPPPVPQPLLGGGGGSIALGVENCHSTKRGVP